MHGSHRPGASSPSRPSMLSPFLSSGVIRVLLAVLAAATWMAISSVLILLNKHIMVALHFQYPMAVSSMGMFTSGLLSTLVCRAGLVESSASVTPMFWLERILPVGFFMALTLWTGNEVYMYLTVAFIQMLKSLTPVITMICLFVARLENPTTQMILSVLLTAVGTAVAAWGEVNLSWFGVGCMMASETGEAIRLVMTQYLLVGLKFHPIEGLMYLAPACTMWLLLGVAFFEWPRMQERGALAIVEQHPWLFLLAAVMGFAVNALAYTTIKLASSALNHATYSICVLNCLTLKVLGTAKNALLVMVGVLFYNELVTPLQGIGYIVSLAGFSWYNHIKIQQIAASPTSAAPAILVGGSLGARTPSTTSMTKP